MWFALQPVFIADCGLVVAKWKRNPFVFRHTLEVSLWKRCSVQTPSEGAVGEVRSF